MIIWDRVAERVRSALPGFNPVVFDVTNIAQHLMDLRHGDGNVNLLTLPCAPPFQHMWLESRTLYKADGSWPEGLRRNLQFGFGAALAATETPPWRIQAFCEEDPAIAACRWYVGCKVFYFDDDMTEPEAFGSMIICIHGDGVIERLFDMTFITHGHVLGEEKAMARARINGGFIEYLMYGLAFINCKNVKRVAVEPPPKLAKKHARKHGITLHRYHTLDIGPSVTGTLRDGARALTESGRQHSLHVVRGHFKTYTEEKPLLGKAVGTFWFPSHARGAADVGIVDKDYNVQ